MTDTQADLTERARAVAVRIVQTDFGDDPLDPITLMTSWIAAFAQSEREAAAARMIPPTSSRKTFALEEILPGFSLRERSPEELEALLIEKHAEVLRLRDEWDVALERAREAFAAEARRAAIEECARIVRFQLHGPATFKEIADAILALALPAPQED